MMAYFRNAVVRQTVSGENQKKVLFKHAIQEKYLLKKMILKIIINTIFDINIYLQVVVMWDMS